MSSFEEKHGYRDPVVVTEPDEVSASRSKELAGAPAGYHGKSTTRPLPGSRLTRTENDVFGNEDDADIKYKTLSWPLVAVLMIAEIVSNGMLSLPAATAVVGIVPGVILIVFLGKASSDIPSHNIDK